MVTFTVWNCLLLTVGNKHLFYFGFFGSPPFSIYPRLFMKCSVSVFSLLIVHGIVCVLFASGLIIFCSQSCVRLIVGFKNHPNCQTGTLTGTPTYSPTNRYIKSGTPASKHGKIKQTKTCAHTRKYQRTLNPGWY